MISSLQPSQNHYLKNYALRNQDLSIEWKNTMTLVKAEKLEKVYQMGNVRVQALQGIDFTLEAGAFAAFIGPSGSGKSTLLNLIGCLDTPSAGRLRVLDTDIAGLSRGQAAAFRGANIGFVFQDFNLIPVLSAAAFDLLLGLRWLMATETTWFVEYYRNGAGYAHHEMESIYAHLRSAATTGAPGTPIEDTAPVLFSGSQLMRDYLHLRSVQKDPFGALYWNTGLTAIINFQYHSASLISELTYTGITDLELRARLVLLTGGTDTEFGERRNHWRGELRARYFF